MAITHHFKSNKDMHGYGYFGYIEDGQLVLAEDWPREGGVTFRGSFKDASGELLRLKDKAPRLYNSIMKYYAEQEAKEREINKQLLEITKYSTIFRVKLFMDNGVEHVCQVRGRFESDVITKLTPAIPEVLVIQDDHANVFAVRSEKISAIEFLDDKLEDDE